MTSKHCPECGVALNANSKFCPECGFRLNDGLSESGEASRVDSKNRALDKSDPVIRKGVVALLQLVVGAIAFFFIYSHFIHPSNSPTPISSGQTANGGNPARTTVTFNGTGGLHEQTAPQELSGNYQIDWKANGACYYSASIGTTDIFSADGPTSGKNYLTGLADGNYFISMITGPAPTCSWSAVFIPTN